MQQSTLRHIASPAIAMMAAVAIAAPANAAPAPESRAVPTTLAGFTSQHMPSFFKLSTNGKELVVGTVALNMSCASGDRGTIEDEFRYLTIKPNGTLSGAWAVPPTKSSDGYTTGGTGTLAARMSHNHLKLIGTWRVQQTYISPTGQSDQCDSGLVRFTAT